MKPRLILPGALALAAMLVPTMATAQEVGIAGGWNTATLVFDLREGYPIFLATTLPASAARASNGKRRSRSRRSRIHFTTNHDD